MNTNTYISATELLSSVLPKIGDKEMKNNSKGFYISLVQQAMEALAITSFFDERYEPFDFPAGTLTLPLPKGCFNIRGIWLFNGNDCVYTDSMKVWWKRNYYTKGTGYIANDKGYNRSDPFYGNHMLTNNRDPSLIRANQLIDVNNRFFYNIQGGNIMFSSSCAAAANKVMICYNGTGCDIDEVPIIPVFLRTAIQDYVIVQALLVRIAEESDARKWQALLNYYDAKLNKPFDGSWAEAEYAVKSLNTSQRNDLHEYLSHGAWSNGF